MSLNYNLLETLKLLINCFNYNIFISIIISSVIFTVILFINKEKSIIKYIMLSFNLILILLIFLYYNDNIFKLSFSINDMYFYFLNSIFYLLIVTIINFKSELKRIDYVIYCISLINILFSIFMTHYLNNIDLLVLGNIYPMIKFGNVIYIIYYIIKIFNYGGSLIESRKK